MKFQYCYLSMHVDYTGKVTTVVVSPHGSSTDHGSKGLLPVSNVLGKDGWELTLHYIGGRTNGSGTETIFWFRRQV